MINSSLEQKIIHAIESRLMLRIVYRKASGQRDDKIVAPYDLFPKTSRDGSEKYFLQGCSEKRNELFAFSTYMENVESVDVLSRNFSGEEVKKCLGHPSKKPYASRSW